MAADLKKEVAAYQEELVRLRRHFHEHPELGYMEYDTARYIEEYMKEIHVPVTHLRKTGLSALITGGKPGKTVLLRADMRFSYVWQSIWQRIKKNCQAM